MTPSQLPTQLIDLIRPDWQKARHVGRLFALCALVGLVAGLGAVAFYSLLDAAKHLFLDSAAGFRPAPALGEYALFEPTDRPFVRWLLLVLPALGGLLSGIFVFALAPEAEGHGTDAAIDAYHRKDGLIRARIPFVKAVASALTIGTGGSAGTEGPITQIGAGFGSLLARLLHLSVRDRRILLAAGMGAGIGAIFKTPLAGALFAAEVLYREIDFEPEVLAPSILASVVAYSVFAFFFGFDPLFATPDFVFRDPRELLPYALLALGVALGARLFIAVFYKTRDAFAALPVPKFLKPMIGGLLTGVAGFCLPEALVTGYGVIQSAFFGGSGIHSHAFLGSAALALLAFALVKMLTTSMSVASGGSGGVFGPAIVIGGALGGSVGLLLERLLPNWIASPGAFAMVGMAGFFAAAARTPISTVIMVSEMTGNYQLLVPSMWVCMLAFLLARGTTLYEKQVASRPDSSVHQAEMMRAVLSRLRVSDALRLRLQLRAPTHLPLVDEAAHFQELAALFRETPLTSLPIVDAQKRLKGQVMMDVLQQTLGIVSLDDDAVNACDLALPPVAIRGSDTLLAVLHRMNESGRHELFVIDEAGVPFDIFSEADITALCEHEIESDVSEMARGGAYPIFSDADASAASPEGQASAQASKRVG
ncbi:MAG: chloride channel protein [Myxococcales bacterium]|nr:chloride channel protein [Myxococcales bacterium]